MDILKDQWKDHKVIQTYYRIIKIIYSVIIWGHSVKDIHQYEQKGTLI